MSIATVADSLNRTEEGELKVLWFDAHPDINTYNHHLVKIFMVCLLVFNWFR